MAIVPKAHQDKTGVARRYTNNAGEINQNLGNAKQALNKKVLKDRHGNPKPIYDHDGKMLELYGLLPKRPQVGGIKDETGDQNQAPAGVPEGETPDLSSIVGPRGVIR